MKAAGISLTFTTVCNSLCAFHLFAIQVILHSNTKLRDRTRFPFYLFVPFNRLNPNVEFLAQFARFESASDALRVQVSSRRPGK